MTLTIHITRNAWLFHFNNNFLRWDRHAPSMPGTARIGTRCYVYVRKQGWRHAPHLASYQRSEVTDYRW